MVEYQILFLKYLDYFNIKGIIGVFLSKKQNIIRIKIVQLVI